MNGQSENSDLSRKFENYTYPVDDSNWEAIAAGIPYGNAKGFLSGKFAAYSVQPSAAVWNRIDAALRPSSGRRIAAWWWAAAAAAVLLFGVFTYVKYTPAPNKAPLAQQKPKTGIQPDSNALPASSKTNSNAVTADTSDSQLSPNFAKAEAKTNSNAAPSTDNAKKSIENDFQLPRNADNSAYDVITADLEENREEVTTGNPYAQTQQNSIEPAKSEESISAESIEIINTEIQIPLTSPALAGQLKEVEFATTESAGKKVKSSPFFDGTEKEKSNEFSVLAGSQLAFAGNGSNQEDMALNTAIGAGTSTPNETADMYESAQYSTPVYYGVNGEIEFLKRLAAGVGLGYLQMRKNSDYYTNISQRTAVETESRYLSIPVYLKFNFIHKPKFSAYTSLGNAFDIQIWQRTTADTYVNEQLTESKFTDDHHKGNQANVYAGLGVTFKFTKHIGLYTEGSLMHYYYSANTNFYSQQNLWPGLRFGAVVSF